MKKDIRIVAVILACGAVAGLATGTVPAEQALGPLASLLLGAVGASGDTGTVSTSPLTCPAGHTLHSGAVLVGWRPCTCHGAARQGGHRTWRCVRCDDEGRGEESVIFDGRHTPE